MFPWLEGSAFLGPKRHKKTEAWTVEYGEAAMDGSGGFSPVENGGNGGGYGGNGGDGKVPEDYQDDGGDDGDDGDDYILSEGFLG